MSDAETVLKECLDVLLDRLDPGPAIAGQDRVAIKRRFVFLHLPQMNMMHAGNAADTAYRCDDRLTIHVRRAAQQQRPDWTANPGWREADVGYRERSHVKTEAVHAG